jgi:hypothetical protein
MSLFGADQVYTCLEKVYMVYTTLPPDDCVLDRYTQWSRAWQWNWQLTYGVLESRLIQNTPVWHISEKTDKRIPRCRIVLHGARRWGLLILEISLIISGPSSIPIVCQVPEEGQELAEDTLSQ